MKLKCERMFYWFGFIEVVQVLLEHDGNVAPLPAIEVQRSLTCFVSVSGGNTCTDMNVVMGFSASRFPQGASSRRQSFAPIAINYAHCKVIHRTHDL